MLWAAAVSGSQRAVENRSRLLGFFLCGDVGVLFDVSEAEAPEATGRSEKGLRGGDRAMPLGRIG